MAESSRPIYPRVDTFSLSTFSNKDFIVKDFIEGLTDNAVPPNRRSEVGNNVVSKAFDPKPYIRAFEAALGRLKELDSDLKERESELKENVRRAEIDHMRTLDRLGNKFHSTLSEFHRLDKNISDGGGVAVKIGGELEKLDKQRQRAEDARFLIQCYAEFSRGETGRLERLRKTGRTDDSIRCAIVTRQLSLVVKRNEGAGINPKTRELIESFSESLEQDLLKQFDAAYRKMNIDAMKGCAKVLHDFNGGASVVSNFLNQMDFFIAAGKITTGEASIDPVIGEKLTDPDEAPPGLELSLSSLIREIEQNLKDESKIIRDVFPYPEQVLGSFVQRIFQQSLQQQLENLLEAATALSPLAFLRTLQAARAAVIALAEDLKEHGLTEHPDPLTSSTAMLLDQNVEELFVPYLQDRGYLEKERESLEQLYTGLLLKFTLFHEQRRRNLKSGLLDRFKNTRERTLEKILESDLGKSQSEALSRLMGFRPGKEHLSDVVITEADGFLKVDFAKRILKWMAEAVGRNLELSPTADTPKDVFVQMQILIEHLKTSYLEVALDAALDTADQQTKGEPDLSYFLELKPATTIMHLMFAFINTILFKLAANSLTTKRDMQKLETSALAALEQKMNSVIQKTVSIVVTYVSTILSRQKKPDYRPKDEEVSLTTLSTQTCDAVCVFLAKTHEIAVDALDGTNLEAFLDEVGHGLLNLLLEHMKKFQVNQAGGMMLSKDIKKYHDVIQGWKVPSLKDEYELMNEIGALYAAGATSFRDRMGQGVLSKMKPALLKPYMMKRDDYITEGIEKILSTE